QQLIPGIGYATWPPSGCSGAGCNYTINFRGKPNNGIVTVPVYHNEPSNGFANLIGNPYPSAIDLDRLFEVNAGLIDPVAYVWGRKVDDTPNNPSSGPYGLNYTEDSYLIYNPTMIVIPSSSSNSAFNDNDFNGISDNGVLASCQSFFVQTVTHTPDYDYNSSLVFNNSIRSKVVNNTFARNSISENQDKLWIDFYNNNLKSQVGIAFLDKGSDGFNSKEDVKKMFDSKLNIYTNTTNYDLIIDVQSKFNSNKKIPLKLKTVEFENQEFKIEINKSSGKLAQENIYLEDKLLNVIYDLSKSPYTFKLDSNITNDRFVILFNKENDSANSNLTYNQISNNQCWSKISVNESWHCNAVKNDGTLWAWGFNDSGQVGDFQCNLVGANCIGQFQIGTETIWEDVTTGSKRSFAKKSNGTLWAWGNNQNGALGISSSATTINTPTQIGTENNWSTIKSFAGSTFAIKQNGTLWAWGANGSGQLGDGTTTNRTTPIQVSLSSNWSKITVGTNHALALKSDGTLWSWGYNYYGALGNGSNVNIIVPTQVGSDNNWVEISAGGNFSMSIKNDGTLWSWGKNDSGQLGQNNLININVPTQVGVENNWYKIISSNQHCLALKVNNTLWAWGYNNGYRLGDGTITNRLLPIQIGTANDWAKINAGGASSMGIKNDNSLFVWGYNNCGQLGTNDNVSLQIPTQIECLQLSNNQFNTNKITIYPNPTKNTLNITTTTPLQKIIIYNLLGAKVYEQAFNEIVDVSSLSSGVYVVKFYGEDNVVFVEKIVKE
ncbi:T9SS type A sorting domain-containing protein, partial [Flavobacterium sp.]|uniref:RCC1 domain-containing protein n=1 Tax=Flavobacterium sp. TaxID=239 RepID=UPI0037539FE8